MKQTKCDKCNKSIPEDEVHFLFWEKDDGSCSLNKIGDYHLACLKAMGMTK